METLVDRRHAGQQDISSRIDTIYRKQKAFFATGATRSYAFRKEQIRKLQAALRRHEDDVMAAVAADFSKPAFEGYLTEVGPLYEDIRHALRNLRDWMSPRKVHTPVTLMPSSSWIYPDPLGNVLIISPWNYPFLLMMKPLISAIAGGNTAILKPSEISAHTAELITRIVEENFDEEYIAVVNGDGEMTGNILVGEYAFDHIFFTGSLFVGRKIMELASRHLSPVTLELGGKSPCIVDKEADIAFSARKIAWSKLVNAGQTCVAPDYVLVHEDIREALIAELKSSIRKMYGEDPKLSPDYPRLISDRRFQSVARFLSEGRIIFGGQADASQRYIAPTLLTEVGPDDLVMKEEIFGPVLPIIGYRDDAEVFQWIERNPYPLALYVYTKNRKVSENYIRNVRFGGGCVNNGLFHLANPELPFGGVGTSGIGQYSGEYGFNTFSRMKSVVKTPTWGDIPLTYAPYSGKLKWLKKIFG